MESNKINRLLEKYWNCETSLEEEQVLREYFKDQDIPESLKETSALFHYFDEERLKTLDKSFDEHVTKRLRQTPAGKVISMPVLKIARIAAGILVVAAAVFFVREEIRKSYPPEVAETYSDPKLALEETKKALMLISNSFNKAEKDAGEIKIFNEAETKIQGKDHSADVQKTQL